MRRTSSLCGEVDFRRRRFPHAAGFGDEFALISQYMMIPRIMPDAPEARLRVRLNARPHRQAVGDRMAAIAENPRAAPRSFLSCASGRIPADGGRVEQIWRRPAPTAARLPDTTGPTHQHAEAAE